MKRIIEIFLSFFFCDAKSGFLVGRKGAGGYFACFSLFVVDVRFSSLQYLSDVL